MRASKEKSAKLKNLATEDATQILSGRLSGDDVSRILEHREDPQYSDRLDELFELDALMGGLEGDSDIESWGRDAINDSVRGERDKGRFGRKIWFSLAATIFLSLGGAWFWLAQEPQINTNASMYLTRVGEQKVVNLTDGSQVVLNTGTKIVVEFSDTYRRIDLAYGEVFVDVAKDQNRPMSVEFGEGALTVLGTSFNLRRTESGFSALVTEGEVVLHDVGETVSNVIALDDDYTAETSSGVSRQLKLSEGMQVKFNSSEQLLNVSVDVDVSSAAVWREGVVSFDGVPLLKAVAELNRYLPRKLIVQDPDIINLPVTAVIKIESIHESLNLLEKALPISVEKTFDQVIISSSKKEN